MSREGTSVMTTVSELRFVLHFSISITWCDMTQVYSFKAFGIHSIILVILYVLQLLCNLFLPLFSPI